MRRNVLSGSGEAPRVGERSEAPARGTQDPAESAPRAGGPRLSVDPALPIAAHAAAIARGLREHRVLIVCGDTGSGKTTQLPKMCLACWPREKRRIGHTQPRRIAARSVAARIAGETGTRIGELVGYQIRFDRRVARRSRLKLMTDGILLAEVQADPELREYRAIIVDEAHERSLNIDVLLGHLRRLVQRRADLSVIVSSATIDTRRFSAFFDNAPVIEVSGRRYPIEVRYRPPPDDDVPGGLCAALSEVYREKGEGDVLVFLASEREIRESADAVRRMNLPDTEVLPLYARLPLRDQLRVFEPGSRRRVVLATNVAETSLTVPRIRYLIDAGRARISRHMHRHAVQRLPVEPISRASADQRKGRCGRIGPGLCIRLYSSEDFDARSEFTEPEILRSSLAALLLRLKAIGVDELFEFPFLDRPERRRLSDAERLLRELGALEGGALTDVGWTLARMPVDPRTGRMLIEAASLGVLDEVLVIASALSVADPRERPPGAETQAQGAHERFRDGRSDFMGLLRLWRTFHQRARARSLSSTRKYCRRHFLSWSAMREWQDVHDQLCQAARDIRNKGERKAPTYGRVHRALLAGLVRNVGMRSDLHDYSGVRDLSFRISPGSVLFTRRPKWVVAADLIETERLYAHRVAEVRPEWIERSSLALLRRTHFDAHWDAARAEAMVYEQTSLYGLTLVPRRRVRFSPVSRSEARALFIRAGLVEGHFESPAECLAHNREVVAGLRRFDHKHRRPDVAIRDRDVFDFYDENLPVSTCDGVSFAAWWQRCSCVERERLMMHPARIGRRPPKDSERDYPDHWRLEDASLPLTYRFSPGESNDGVRVDVPRSLLGRLDPGDFEWHVPGLRQEKVLSMLRALPKPLRRELMPLPEVAARFVVACPRPTGSLAAALRRYLWRHEGVPVEEEYFRPSRLARELPPHLTIQFQVLGESGETLGAGRDLALLQRRFGPHVGAGTRAATGFERSGLIAWDFDTLPEAVDLEQCGSRWRAYPALIDRGDSVDLSLVDAREDASALTQRGLLRLLMIRAAPHLKKRRRTLPGIERLGLAYALVPPVSSAVVSLLNIPRRLCESPPGLAEELAESAGARAFLSHAPEVRSSSAFEAAYRRGEERLAEATDEVFALCERILERYREVRAKRSEVTLSADSAADVERQLSHLVFRGFLLATGWSELAEIPRYLEALTLRLEKIRRGGAGDARKLAVFEPFWTRFADRGREQRARGRRDPELERYRWMLEEFRVSLFAQEIGTAYRISERRLEAQWARVSP